MLAIIFITFFINKKSEIITIKYNKKSPGSMEIQSGVFSGFYSSLFSFSIISESSSLEKSPKLINARNGMESVIARTISSEMASVAASEADSSPLFMLERYFEVSSFANSLVRRSRNSSPRVVFI